MPADVVELGSDSESECSDYSVTQTQLGVSDGPLESQDENNPLVSRMGGQVAWLPSKAIPPVSYSTCPHCSQQMEMLVQIFAPLDNSPYDRLLLVWGCARRPCQKQKQGSVRALRVLTYNARWAAKLEKKRKRQEAKDLHQKKLQEMAAAREKEEEALRKKNPFAASAKAGGLNGGLFGSDTNLFSPAPTSAPATEIEKAKEGAASDSDTDEDDALAEEMAIKASLASNDRSEVDWTKDAPAYRPAQYLSTYAEPSSSARAYEESKESKQQLKKLKESGGVGEMKGWEAEKYESMMVSGIDETFERFVNRVSQDGKQVVRYEFGGTPLPFHAKGPAYEKLWAKKRPSSTTISGGAFKDNGRDTSREYSSGGISSCSLCGSKRVFELQLMPNLVNTLRPEAIVGGQQGEEEDEKDAEKRRKRDIEEALGHKLPEKPDEDGVSRTIPDTIQADPSKLPTRTGLIWSTAMIFVCEKDCRGSESNKGEIWSEEAVELQFEHES